MRSEKNGIVFSLQRLSAHDGPGWRTLVFLKGCPLSCRWCSNPESWDRQPELAFNPDRCIGIHECTRCFDICPLKAVSLSPDENTVVINRNTCDNCGLCADECPPQALYMFGQSMTLPEVLRKIEEDALFYSRSGGGLTLGGGEPILQAEFATDLLAQAKKRGLHTAIETCGVVPRKKLELVCRHVDHVLYDIKSVDKQKHKAYTGSANTRILNNLKWLNNTLPQMKVTVRTPVVSGFNDTPDDISAIIDWLKSNTEISDYELLPYHRFGSPKYGYLDRSYQLAELLPPSVPLMKKLNALVKSRFCKP